MKKQQQAQNLNRYAHRIKTIFNQILGLNTKSFFYSLVIVLICIVFLFGCDSKKNQTTEDQKIFTAQQQDWKSNRIQRLIGDIKYTATEVPLQYYLYRTVGNDTLKIDSISKANSKERIVEIEFQHADEADLLSREYTKRDYEDAVKYMAFEIKKDFTIITSSNDTIRCSGVNFERNFKVAPFKRALLYFNSIHPKDAIKLVYQDELFGNGILKFNFNKTPIKL